MNLTVCLPFRELLRPALTCIGCLTGQGIVLGGFTPGNTDVLDGVATYSLDFGPPTEFRIPRSAEMKTNQPYFSITNMAPGPHRLEVVNKGNISTAPLAFRYIYTKNAPIQATALSTHTDASTSHAPTQTATTAESKPSDAPKFIGGIIGGGFGVLLLAALLVLIVKRRRRRRRVANMNLTPSAFVPETRMAIPGLASSDLPDFPTVPTVRGEALPEQPPRSNSPPPAYAALSSRSPTFYTDPHTPLSNSSPPGAISQNMPASVGVDTSDRIRRKRG